MAQIAIVVLPSGVGANTGMLRDADGVVHLSGKDVEAHRQAKPAPNIILDWRQLADRSNAAEEPSERPCVPATCVRPWRSRCLAAPTPAGPALHRESER
ncbi:hypothetical protein ABZ958_34280 [Streptomyces sp. NPDC046237]|uniref:hypothetical protein n=1 Tax=Streptomyces sp. NPDC046237 TaxID=3154914 RepID=UPI00340B0D6F